MKKTLCAALSAILALSLLSACPGGAWYPGPTELWMNYSQVVTKGNYVMLVVGDDCEQIVSDFNALFQ